MKKVLILVLLIISSCKKEKKEIDVIDEELKQVAEYSTIEIEPILEMDSLSVRAIEIIGNNVAFAANNGTYGLYNAANNTWKINTQKFEEFSPEFRAVASTANDFFMLSVGSPALLYKTGDNGNMELVYQENDEKAFYDAIAFWNDKEGIAIGDPTETCISIIITRDGGKSWNKIACENLPEAAEGEAAFAASNSNIAIKGNKAWVLTGGVKSRIFYTEDKGKSWEVFDTPILQGEPTQGGYSLDFYDDKNGFIIGGDYTKPNGNIANKSITSDGGKTWQLVADSINPGYKSSIRYVPNSSGKHLIATGFTGIEYSRDAGKSWQHMSDEGFYTMRFLNDSTAYAAGKGRIARIRFR
ncbi:oxidoreductase [Gramella sp. AN32]|uniref:WD40/YVTN/BNR-like repeat-containing protein n=1 Tax=Christiangramia antarctica TaxID=2058158 RepID=A0ABW5X9Q3_9FLAO|nr:oxidoreductase [Gramella sp. AN32]MCM4156533.1 oxidoreductase [Gramella sp. AN32]